MVKRILMTGITGLVGSAYAVKLLKKDSDIQIIALARGDANNTSAKDKVHEIIHEQCNFDLIPKFAYKALRRIEVIEGDVTSAIGNLALEHLKDIDTVFHCAASVNLGKDPSNNVYISNLTGTRNMIELARKLKVKSFHYVSTAYVAGKTDGVIPEDGLIPNNTFNNAYEKSKYDAELLVRASGLPFSIYRPSIIVGRLSDGKIRKPLAFYKVLEFFGILKKQYCLKTGKLPDAPVPMHLRLETATSDKIYFVPIDYVKNTIYELSLLQPQNRTYHITGRAPAAIKDIVLAICKSLNLGEGISFHKKIDNPTLKEKMITRFVGDLYPYFSSESLFNINNVIMDLGEEDLNWKMDKAMLQKIVNEYYLETFPEIIPKNYKVI